MSQGVDYSFSRPGGAALAAAGKSFAVRYLSSTGKGLTTSELNDLKTHGIAVVLCFEAGANRVLYGSTAGSNDASIADKQRKALGLPELPIYFAVDFDAIAGQQGSIDAYMHGAANVIGANRVGVYGSADVVSRCRTNHSAIWFWQTYAWSHGVVAPGIHLYQYKNGQTINGGAVDFCESFQNNYGQYVASPQVGVKPMFDPPEAFVDFTNFYSAKLGKNCAVAVKSDGSIFCKPAEASLGGWNGAAAFAGRRAAIVEDNHQGGYKITTTSGEKYSLPEGTSPDL